MSSNTLKKLPKDFSFFLSRYREDNIFMLALVASLCLHALTLAALAIHRARVPAKSFKKIEVVYQAAPAAAKESFRRVEERQSLKDKKAEATPQILTPKDGDQPAFMKDLGKSPSQYSLTAPAVSLSSATT